MFSNWPNSLTANSCTILSRPGLPVRTKTEYLPLPACWEAKGAICVLTVEHPQRTIRLRQSRRQNFMLICLYADDGEYKQPRASALAARIFDFVLRCRSSWLVKSMTACSGKFSKGCGLAGTSATFASSSVTDQTPAESNFRSE